MPKDCEIKHKFDIYIKTLVPTVHAEVSIDSHAVRSVNSMMHELVRKICGRVNSLMRDNNRKTVTVGDIRSACRLVYGEEAKYPLNEANRALTKFKATNPKAVRNRADRAEIVVAPSLMEHLIKKHITGVSRLSYDAGVCLAAVVEFTTMELIEIASGITIRGKRKLITRKDLVYALELNDELGRLFQGTIANAKLPGAHAVLIDRR